MRALQFITDHVTFKLLYNPLYLVPNLRSVAQIDWKNTHIYIFSTFDSKINDFELKKLEKNQKNSRHLKVAGNLIHTVFQVFCMKN